MSFRLPNCSLRLVKADHRTACKYFHSALTRRRLQLGSRKLVFNKIFSQRTLHFKLFLSQFGINQIAKGRRPATMTGGALTGKEKKLLLNRLPEKFNEVLYPDTRETVKQIWQVNIKYRFCILYLEIPKVYFICCDKMGLCQY